MKRVGLIIILGIALVISGYQFWSSNSYSKEVYESSQSIHSIEVVDSNTPIEIIGTNTTKVKVTYYENKKESYTVDQSGDRLVIKKKRKSIFSWNISFFSFTEKDHTVVVEVPKDQLQEVTAKTSNGKISVEELSLDSLDVKTSNSSIQIDSISVDELLVKTSNGKITLNDAAFTDGELTTSNSKLSLEDVQATTLVGQTSNGKIDLEDVRAADASFKTSNSSISVSGIAVTKFLSLNTSNGKISGDIIGSDEDYAIDSKTSNGKNSLENLGSTGAAEKQLEVKTSNAQIQITFNKND